MCGLSGMAGTINDGFTAGHHGVFGDLLYLMALRGQDSTGVGAVPRWLDAGSDPTWLKTLGGPWDMLAHRNYEKMMKSGMWRCLLGHNRSSTVGRTSLSNAHPFMHSGAYSKNILGMHNGTVDSLSKKHMKDGESFGTDSEAIIYNIAAEGPEKTIKKLCGAYTLVWYDETKNTLNMIRNEKRPMAFVLSKDEKTLFFGSETSLLRAGLVRNGISTGDYYNLPENILHSWEIPKYDGVFDAPVEQKIEGVTFAPVVSNHPEWIVENGQYKKKGGTGTSTSVNPTTTGGNSNSKTSINSIHQTDLTPMKQVSALKGISKDKGFEGFQYYGEFNGLRVYFDKITEHWIEAVEVKGSWNKTMTSKFAPKFVPYTRLDVNSNHAFRHIGKKKKKQVFFRGWQDKLLSREDTEMLFSFRCCACQRVPAWGNYVMWLNATHDFLCEHCAESPSLVRSWKDAA